MAIESISTSGPCCHKARVAVDQMGHALVYNGRTNSWTKPKLIDSGNVLASVSCAAAVISPRSQRSPAWS